MQDELRSRFKDRVDEAVIDLIWNEVGGNFDSAVSQLCALGGCASSASSNAVGELQSALALAELSSTSLLRRSLATSLEEGTPRAAERAADLNSLFDTTDVDSPQHIEDDQGESSEAVLRDLLELISSQQTIIDQLGEENLALKKRLTNNAPASTNVNNTNPKNKKKLRNKGTPIAAVPHLVGGARPLTYQSSNHNAAPKANLSSDVFPSLTADSSVNNDDDDANDDDNDDEQTSQPSTDDLHFLREMFDRSAVSDEKLRREYGACGSVHKTIDALLRAQARVHEQQRASPETSTTTTAAQSNTRTLWFDPRTTSEAKSFDALFDASQQQPAPLIDRLRADKLVAAFPSADADAVRALLASTNGDVAHAVAQLRANGITSPEYAAASAPPRRRDEPSAPLPRGPTYRGPPATLPQPAPKRSVHSGRFNNNFQTVTRRARRPAGSAATSSSSSAADVDAADALADNGGRNAVSVSASLAAARITCLRSAAMLRATGRHADASRMQHKASEFETRRRETLDRFFAARFRQDELRTTIDLHGQAVSDAVTLCEEVIELCRALVARKEGALASHYLCIITGAGHHSAGNLPRVRPAVEKLLLARGISYRAANAGSFVARILKTS